MQLTIPRNDLFHSVLSLYAVAEHHPTLPTLSHLLLETGPSMLSLTATNLGLTVRQELPARIAEQGTIALPARKFYDILRELPDAPLDVSANGNLTAALTCNNAEFTVKGLPSDDFPALHRPDQQPLTLALDRRLLREMLRRTVPAACAETNRYALNSVLLRIAPDAIKAVATDGHRLAMASYRPAGDSSDDQAGDDCRVTGTTDAIIPRKTAIGILKLLPDQPGEASIEIAQDYLLLQTDHTRISARLMKGQFPHYEQVIPTGPTKQATLDREALSAALRRTSTIADERAIPTTLALQSGKLLVSCTNRDLGDAKEALDADYQHEEMTIGFNARYLLDFLGAATTDQVTIQLQDPISPALFTGTGDQSYACVIMPMRL